MNFYDKLNTQKTPEKQPIVSTKLDNDVKQLTLLRSLVSYFRKHGSLEGYVEYYSTPKGDNHLKRIAKFAGIDQYNSSNMKPRRSNKDGKELAEDMKRPLYLNEVDPLGNIEDVHHSSPELNIMKSQRQMEVKDQIRSLYENGDDFKKQAMELMVEAMNYRDDGLPVPDRIRTSISRLRTEIQKTDPRWKLDVTLL